ncbi:MAG: hypothetical protein LBB76_00730 [Azoarcus sp.]|jgi:hypothetical protein|nr:hypothetical protein [Azoarcus sp.]
MSAPPVTYADWSACLDRFEAGGEDEAVMAAMSQGALAWGAGVAPLFAERIVHAFNVRLKRSAERMERDFQYARDETVLARALLDARRALALLNEMAALPTFPEDLRAHLHAEVRRHAERAQKSLEDSARQDRSGRLGNLVRQNTLLAFAQASNSKTTGISPPPPATPAVPGETSAPLSRGRRVLFQKNPS